MADDSSDSASEFGDLINKLLDENDQGLDRKDHRNGVHKVKKTYKSGMKGVDQKFVLNLKWARKNQNPSARQIKKLQLRKDNWNKARGMPAAAIVLNRQVAERKALMATRQGRAKLMK